MKRWMLAILMMFVVAIHAADKSIGTVVSTTGSVSAQLGKGEKRPLKANSPVYLGDTVFVGMDSFAQIVLNDNSAMNLLSGTVYTFKTFKYSDGASDNQYVSYLAKGGFRLLAGDIASGNPDQYQINTPVATIGIRGTTIDALLGKTNLGALELAVQVLSGSVNISNPYGAANAQTGMGVTTTAGQAPIIVQGTPAGLSGQTFVGPGQTTCPAQ